ncbi:MAG: exonuclease domain-containing protein [Thiohalospira sp.]
MSTGGQWRRRWLARRTPPGPLADYLATPFPPADRDCREVEFLALDLETTGLDPARDEIISMGLIPLRGGRLELGRGLGLSVRPEGEVGADSVAIHGLTDTAVAAGQPLEAALEQLLGQLAGRVLLAHYAPFELAFLDRACRAVYGGRFTAAVVDTQWLEHRHRERRGQPVRAADLRLDAVREAWGLPPHRAHDALADAVAAGELFLAQWADRAGSGRLPLKAVLSPARAARS